MNDKKFYNRPMLESVDWEEKKYQEVFDDDVQGILDSLYVLDGNNAEGRSSVQQIALSATIAAYEAFIHQWQKESSLT